MSKKIIITVGGTGGHVYPALALAKQLSKADPSVQLLFVGGNLHQNRYFDRNVHAYESVSCGPVSRSNLLRTLQSTGKIIKGMWQSHRIMKTFNPDLVVGFGSYYTFPTLLAAKLSSVPFLLHEANSTPGKVNKLLSKYALTTGIHFPEVARSLNGKTVEVGMPLREGYALGSVSRKQALDYFSLGSDKVTLLVFGGSQGALVINELVVKALTGSFDGKVDQIQVIHITGDKQQTARIEEAYAKVGIAACVKDFEHKMDLAWQATDLMISRAGAGTIAEQMEFEVPGILIPYPEATDKHQDKNADFIAKKVGGAICCSEASLTPQILAQKIELIINHDHILIRTMRQAIREYNQRQGKTDLCSLILHLVEKHKK